MMSPKLALVSGGLRIGALCAVGGAVLLTALYVGKKRSRKHGPMAKPIGLDELATLFSRDSDRMILEETQQRQGQFVSGRLTVQLTEDGYDVLLRLTLYFQDPAGQWLEQAAKRQLPVTRLTAEALAELKQRTTITYEIEAPAEAATAAAGEQRQGG